MTFFEEHSGKIAASIIGLITAGGTWLVRTIFTNHKKIALLEQKQDMQHREAMKGLTDVQSAVHEIQTTNNTAVETQAKIVEMLREVRDR